MNIRDLDREYNNEITEIGKLLNQQSSTASKEDDELQIILTDKINKLFDKVTNKYGEETAHLLNYILF